MRRITRRTALLTAGVITGASLGGGIALARIPDSNTGQITACVDTSTGAIRVIDPTLPEPRVLEPLPANRCIDTETELTWQSAGLRFRSSWSPTIAYQRDDIVTVNGASYIALTNNTGQNPTTSTRATP